MKKLLLLVFAFLFLFSSSFAQKSYHELQENELAESVGMSSERLKLLDAHIQKYLDNGTVPGGVFMVMRRGNIVYNKAFGQQAPGSDKAYAKDDIFRLASMTKAVTTVAIMQLYEQGELGLDDPISYYIPEFAKSVVMDEYNAADTSYTHVPAKSPITIRHLLTHTSGITYGLFNPGKIQAVYEKIGANAFGLSHPTMTTRQMAAKIAEVPLIFQPGERYMYGLNMEVLGAIVEIVSGEALGQYFKNNIFDPLGMKDTWFYQPKANHARLVPVCAYNMEAKKLFKNPDPNLNYPLMEDPNHYAGGGGLSGTAMDYAIFIQALVNGGTYKGKRILSRKTIEVMTSDQLIKQNEKGTGYSKDPGMTYGLGFQLKTGPASSLGHKSPGTYEWGGVFNTKFFIDPAEELTFVGMTQVLPFTRPDFWDRMYAIIYGSIED
ncbi:MAG: serine hydrolase domain-containing protein [Bacteroidota bacterium]